MNKTRYEIHPYPIFQSQFASRLSASEFLDDQSKITDDELWHTFGFENIEDYSLWAFRLCGVICLKMVLDASQHSNDLSIADLKDIAVDAGGYVLHDEDGNFVDKGWYYHPLIKTAEKFGIEGEVHKELSINEIVALIDEGHFVVASVNPKVIRGDMDDILEGDILGGHLVLVYGYTKNDSEIDSFVIHNPSGRTQDTQEAVVVDITRFENSFAKRGFSLKTAESNCLTQRAKSSW